MENLYYDFFNKGMMFGYCMANNDKARADYLADWPRTATNPKRFAEYKIEGLIIANYSRIKFKNHFEGKSGSEYICADKLLTKIWLLAERIGYYKAEANKDKLEQLDLKQMIADLNEIEDMLPDQDKILCERIKRHYPALYNDVNLLQN